MRQALLTDDLIDKVCDVIVDGNYRTIAFAGLGIPRSTWSEWVRLGKAMRNEKAVLVDKQGTRMDPTEHHWRCAELVRRLEIADFNKHDGLVKPLFKAAHEGDVAAATFLLKHQWNKAYTTNPNAILDDEDGSEYKIDAIELLRERLERMITRAEADAQVAAKKALP